MAAPAKRPRHWLDYDEVAQVIGCTPNWVRILCNKKLLPYRIIMWRRGHYQRRKRLILDTDVMEFLHTRYRRPRLPFEALGATSS